MTTTEFNTQVQQLTKYLRPFAMKLTHNSENASDLIQETHDGQRAGAANLLTGWLNHRTGFHGY